MNKKFLGVGVMAVIIIIIVGVNFIQSDTSSQVELLIDTGYDYSILNSQIKDALNTNDILISSPIILRSDNTIEKYCSFFTDEKKQQQVKHCTSTELRESDGTFLGNIHMVGSVQSPITVITILQSDPFVTQINEIKSTFSSVIETSVCDCWEKGPKEFSTINSWVDGIYEFHSNGEKTTSKSQVITIDGKKLQIELTTNTEGYLWKLFIDL